MTLRPALRRVHVWLGWVVGVPLLFWTVSGLWMAARPIDEVRGTALRSPPPVIALPPIVRPPAEPGAIRSLTLEMQQRGPTWLIGWVDGRQSRADAATGRPEPPVGQREARRIALLAYAPQGRIVGLRRHDADAAPVELRQPRPAWQVSFADGAHVFIDRDTGRVLALRTDQWRAYDWMWGLHIMDLGTREDTSHGMLILFAGLATVTTVLALVLLPMTGRRGRPGKSRVRPWT